MKTAWIFPGGSARAVYTAGGLYALSEMSIPKPDIIIACSGSAPTALCYVSGQKEIIKNVWCLSLSNTKFLNFFRFSRILDINYLIDIIIKKNNPLNLDFIKNSSIKCFIPLTNSRTGDIDYYSNRDSVDLMEVSRAATWVPFAASLFNLKGVKINNQFYFDSGVASRFPIHVKKAIKEGAERIIVFDSWHKDDNPKHLLAKIFTYFKNKEYKRNQLDGFKEVEQFQPPSDVEFHYFSPKERLYMSRWNNDNTNANKVFKRGYDDIMNSAELIKLYGTRTNRKKNKID